MVPKGNSTDEMLKNFGTIMGVPAEKIRTFLGNDIQKLEKLKMEDLLSTFLESLKQMAEKKDKETVQQECLSTKMAKRFIFELR